MKIILYKWGSNSERILHKTLTKLGHEVIICSLKCKHYTRDLELARELIELVHKSDSEAVISYNYFPIISMVCKTTGIQYYSWVYDSPHHTLLAHAVQNECNHIGCFDKAMSEHFNISGIKTISYLPLGNIWEDAIDRDERYSCDISFVGSLYTDKYNYYDNIYIPEDIRRRAEDFIYRQRFVYDRDALKNFFVKNGEPDLELQNRLRVILTEAELMPGEDYYEDIDYIFRSSVLEKKVTVDERRILLEKIAGTDYKFELYTGSDLKDDPLLNKVSRGYIDYARVMPLVFRNSKINLNITLRSIHTGIPLRALDIMGCGGFLLSNYQEEIAEMFEEDKEVVLFRDIKECLDKMEFYLNNDDKRREIAEAGCRAVRKRFGYKEQLEKLFEL